MFTVVLLAALQLPSSRNLTSIYAVFEFSVFFASLPVLVTVLNNAILKYVDTNHVKAEQYRCVGSCVCLARPPFWRMVCA